MKKRKRTETELEADNKFILLCSRFVVIWILDKCVNSINQHQLLQYSHPASLKHLSICTFIGFAIADIAALDWRVTQRARTASHTFA